MNKKGFTLAELLGVIVVIAILSTIAVISVNYITNNSKESLYTNYESTIESAVRNYFIDNPELIPPQYPPPYYAKIRITYTELLNSNMVEQFKDPKGGNCGNSYVEVTRYPDNNNNMDLRYKTCLICEDNGKYTHMDSSCSDTTSVYFNVTGSKTATILYHVNFSPASGGAFVKILNSDGSIKNSYTESGTSTLFSLAPNEKVVISNLKKCENVSFSGTVDCGDSPEVCDEFGECQVYEQIRDFYSPRPPLEVPCYYNNRSFTNSVDSYC